MRFGVFGAAVLVLSAGFAGDLSAQDSAGGKKPAEAIGAEKGSLKNPFKGDKAKAEEGHKIYMAAGCNGCHGGSGGGGMGPPLTNAVWIYGNDDDTLYRLITLGSKDLAAAGYSRKGSESVKGPMPAFKDIVKSEEDMWKLIAWIQSLSGAN